MSRTTAVVVVASLAAMTPGCMSIAGTLSTWQPMAGTRGFAREDSARSSSDLPIGHYAAAASKVFHVLDLPFTVALDLTFLPITLITGGLQALLHAPPPEPPGSPARLRQFLATRPVTPSFGTDIDLPLDGVTTLAIVVDVSRDASTEAKRATAAVAARLVRELPPSVTRHAIVIGDVTRRGYHASRGAASSWVEDAVSAASGRGVNELPSCAAVLHEGPTYDVFDDWTAQAVVLIATADTPLDAARWTLLHENVRRVPIHVVAVHSDPRAELVVPWIAADHGGRCWIAPAW